MVSLKALDWLKQVDEPLRLTGCPGDEHSFARAHDCFKLGSTHIVSRQVLTIRCRLRASTQTYVAVARVPGPQLLQLAQQAA